MAGSELEPEIAAAPQLSPHRLAELTSKLVSIPSVNGEHPEVDIAVEIGEELDAAGFEVSFVGDESRPSLGAKVGDDPVVLLNGHLDTVPADDADQWRYDPYSGTVADGAVHGRGACDMKGGLAVQVAVAQWLATKGLANGLVLHFAMGEERGEPGTEDLLAAGFVAPKGMVLEPTDLRVGVAQRGLVTLRVEIEGRAGHASRPELTDNPVDRLGTVLAVLSRLDDNPSRSHPLLGNPKWTATMVSSGVIPSMVPASCTVHVDRRMVPGETVEGVLAELRQALVAVAGVTVEVASEEGIYEPAEIARNCETVLQLTESLSANGEDVDLFGTPYSSDIRHLVNTAGVEAVTFGPGRPTEMHARDEFIAVDDLTRAARVVAAFTVRAIRAS
ncbi:MAG: M20 family metallopeptidase [Acidimicrobiia bacterium]